MSRALGDLLASATFFAAIAHDFTKGHKDELEAAAVILETEAKDLIGIPHGEWPPLAAVTIERKGMNSPLLDTGEMKDSITHNSDAKEAHVGSNNKKLLYHEFGSINKPWNTTNPARPVLGLAVIKAEPAITAAVGRVTMTRLVK